MSHALRLASLVLSLIAGPAIASTSGVVISQVYGGNGNTYNRDYVELFNAGSAPVSIAGWSVQYASATGPGNFSGGVTPLTGTLQPGQFYLVGLASSAGGAALPAVDASGSTNISGTAGKLALVDNGTGLTCNGGSTTCTPAQLARIVDLVGYGGANFFEGSPAPAPSATTAALRAAAGCTDTDNNAGDFVIGAPAPRNSASPLLPCGGNAPVVPSCPATADVATGFSVTLSLRASDADDIVSSANLVSGAAGISLSDFVPAAADGASASVSLGVASTVGAGSYPLVVRFGNGVQTADCGIALTVRNASAGFTPIYTIQGSGPQSLLAGQAVTTRGVVTRLNNNGYYLQDATGDGNPATSDGLFVFTGSAPGVGAGQLIEVSGQVVEFNTGSATNPLTSGNTVTEITGPSAPLLMGNGSIIPTPISLPEAFPGELERYEGMLVSIGSSLVVSQNYFQGRYGQVTLGAQSRLLKPTQLYRPGSSAALALADQNLRASIVLDDGTSAQNPTPIPYIGADNTLRAGDVVSGVTGVIDYGLATNDSEGLADWRIHPTIAPVITRQNVRTATPPPVGGNLKVASFNVLNYFTTFTNGQTASGQTGQGCAPSGTTSDCRGADNASEFTRQRSKIIAAIAAIDADIVGLMEIQNNGTTAAQNLVDGLNAVAGPGSYAVVPSPPTTGTDAIRVAMIYRPGRVALVGSAMSDAHPVHNRPPMAQTFRLLANNERLSVVVNHFKSKGCSDATGSDLDQGDGQGCFNQRRTLQAQQLLNFISSVQTAAADNDVLVIGDLNAYGQEDPVFTLTAGGLVDQALRFDGAPYSYVFDGEAGTLDHGLATSGLSPRVVGAVHWHINADEPSVIDYNTEFKPQDLYSSSVFRSSDHDPLIVGLDLQGPQAQTISFAVLPDRALGDPAFSLVASASSGLAVSYSSLTPSVCSVTGANVNLLALGSCSIAADQAGNAAFLPAPQVVRDFVVRQAQSISFAPLPPRPLAAGGFALTATSSSGLAVSYVSNTPAVCSVTGSELTPVAIGNCSITASQAGNAQFAAAAAVTQIFEVAAVGTAGEGDVPLPLWALVLLGSALMAGLQRRGSRTAP